MNIPLKTVYYLKGNLNLKEVKPKYTKETRLKVKKMAKKELVLEKYLKNEHTFKNCLLHIKE